VSALGVSACTITFGNPAGAGKATAAQPSSPARTITTPETATPPGTPATQAPASPAATPPATPASVQTVPNVTDPWAVVSAYYGDVESGNYAEAYALLSSGLVTGQSYQDFVAGYACTGSQQVTEISESGDQVTFDLAAYDNCQQTYQYFTGTDTVQDGKIVAASVSQTG
jgi:hypothetical protein